MKKSALYNAILKKVEKGAKQLAVLIDPGKQNFAELLKTIHICNQVNIDFFLVGGSTVSKGDLNKTVHAIKENSSIPILLFPGDYTQTSDKADGILFLSLLSGNNPDYLIGNQILATPTIEKSNLEVIPTGYILIEGGKETAVVRVSQTEPIPHVDIEKAKTVALTGEYLGKQLIYLEAGSGALKSVSPEMIELVKKTISIPLIVGGGIRDLKTASQIYTAGADIIVIGNKVEENRHFISEMAQLKSELFSKI
ncbi:MAG: geranylgeranylglyceryl/heptaprenylglyceryl phosphate synthase [Flavobacteriales bacterium]|nr:geranylgeranylglyceryl/heptaprenylglyceryl phosphate synthase [Flavobacteriales bacterium]